MIWQDRDGVEEADMLPEDVASVPPGWAAEGVVVEEVWGEGLSPPALLFICNGGPPILIIIPGEVPMDVTSFSDSGITLL